MAVPRVFLDANVLFAAAWNPEGRCALLIELGRMRRIALLTSTLAVIEARRNLELKKPRALSELERAVENVRVVREPGAGAVERLSPPSLSARDRPILAAAIAAGATHFVTGDRRDYGPWMTPGSPLPIRVLTPRRFFDDVEPGTS